MHVQGRDVVRNVCQWVRTQPSGGFGAKSQAARIFEQESYHVASLTRSARAAPAATSTAFSTALTGIVACLVGSIAVNIVYVRKS